MEDKYFFGAMIYLFVSIAVAGMLPTEVYTGASENLDREELIDSLNQTGERIESTSEQVSFLFKVLSYFFVPLSIDGIPSIMALIISFINLMCVLIGIIWTYDKARGI